MSELVDVGQFTRPVRKNQLAAIVSPSDSSSSSSKIEYDPNSVAEGPFPVIELSPPSKNRTPPTILHPLNSDGGVSIVESIELTIEQTRVLVSAGPRGVTADFVLKFNEYFETKYDAYQLGKYLACVRPDMCVGKPDGWAEKQSTKSEFWNKLGSSTYRGSSRLD